MAVDPVTNKALIGAIGGFTVEDLTTHAGSFIAPGGQGTYAWPVWIPGTRDFLVEEAASPDFNGSTPNNNTMASMLVVDENGNVVHRYEQFNFGRAFLLDAGAYTVLASYPGSANYNAASAVAAFTITPATLTVTAAGQNKVYDGTTTATVSLSDNRVSGDQLTFRSRASSQTPLPSETARTPPQMSSQRMSRCSAME